MDYVKVIVEIAYKIIKVIKKEVLGKEPANDTTAGKGEKSDEKSDI